MTSLSLTPGGRALERFARPGLIALMLLAVVASAAALVCAPGDLGKRAVQMTIAGLAMFGAFGVIMYAAGLVRFVGRSGEYDLAREIAESSEVGCVVTSAASRVLYANSAYRALGGGQTGPARSVERLFSGAPEVAQAIYRLSQAARSGGSHTEEVRLSPPLAGAGEAAWYRIKVRPLTSPAQGQTALWTVSDISKERDKHETFFQDLQHAIDYLDHAPAGFFSA